MPAGFHSVTPYFAVEDAGAAIAFYEKAFGAVERYRLPGMDGKGVGHAEITIGNSILMLSDEFPEYGAHEAAAFTEKRLAAPFTVWTRWRPALGRSALGRVYCIIFTADGRDLNELLVENGLARIYGTRTALFDGRDSRAYLARPASLRRRPRPRTEARGGSLNEMPLEPHHQRHVTAAEGCVALRMYLDADVELDAIEPESRHAPEVLAVRVATYAALEKWELMEAVARRLARREPDSVQWTVSLAFATRRSLRSCPK